MTAAIFQHTFANVEDYLHHRDPSLLVRNIESIAENSIETSTVVTGDDYFLGGHFPGAPIDPGGHAAGDDHSNGWRPDCCSVQSNGRIQHARPVLQ